MDSVAVKSCEILRFGEAASALRDDMLAVEEPLEIRVAYGAGAQRRRQSVAVTMRTPGHDFELAMGFLFTEGLIGKGADVTLMRYVGDEMNVLLVELHPDFPYDPERLSRHFYASSSCGVCGKGSIEMVQTHSCYTLAAGEPMLSVDLVHGLPAMLSEHQDVFACTGGLHAAGLFDAEGHLLILREDVGRHNAVDKLVGVALREGRLPLRNRILLVSGRAGFELVQKAVMAGIPVLAAVGAPSSLSVSLAETYGMTLIGFLRDKRFNVYTGRERFRQT
jgi:FdhD protein